MEHCPPPLEGLLSHGESILAHITLYYNSLFSLARFVFIFLAEGLDRAQGGVGKKFAKEEDRADEGSYSDDGNIR